MTLVNDTRPALAPLPVYLRGRLGRAFVAWAAEAGETGRLQRLIYTASAIAGILGTILCCILYVVLLPDGSSVQRTNDLLTSWRIPAMCVVLFFPVAFIVLIWAVGSFAARLWQADTSKGHALSFIAFASDLMLFAVFAVELALAGGLFALVGHPGTSPEFIHGIFVMLFTSAYILGPLWLPFFVATIMISRRSNLLPRWLELTGWWAAFWTFVPIIGIFFLSGPFNMENGLIGVGAQTYGPVAWVAASWAWMIAQWAPTYFKQHAGSHSGAADVGA